ncbi:MAG: hypothetical protein NC319_09920 [Butyricicoccus sp.]|nr:hypothetical protein [Butyricicoccus sp.]
MLLYSLISGLLAWALAALAIKKYRRNALLTAGSMLLACVSAVWQLFELRRRALGGDWSGILDTIDVTIEGVIIMLSVTLLLNFIALLRRDAS